MENIVQIDNTFIEQHTNFKDLVKALKNTFKENQVMVPMRHHHDFPNPVVEEDSTLLLMPAWNPGKEAGVKVVTVSPENGRYELPSIQGTYLYLDAVKGTIRAIMEAKSLTAKRTAAASALASSFLSKASASSMLMIGTGALSVNLIQAHCSVRPIKKVYIWGRSFDKAKTISEQLDIPGVEIQPIKTIEERIGEVDIISTATLSKTPLVKGECLRPGQHLDLVGAYKKDTREADNDCILKGNIYLDTYQGGLKESGDIVIPLAEGILKKEEIKADLFELCSGKKKGRANEDEITVFKSVGHALEDLTAATYYFNQYQL